MTTWLRALSLTTLATLTLVGTSANAQPAVQKPQCFRSSDWRGWRATPDASALYIRVGARGIYRVDFAHACNGLGRGSQLVHRSRGGRSICSALDLDLRVAVGSGMSTPCIASKLTQLTPEEATALPKGLRP